MSIYQPLIVKAIQQAYGDLLPASVAYPLQRDHLAVLAERMLLLLERGEEAALAEVSNYHPAHLGKSAEELRALSFTKADAQHTTARQYGFANWEAVTQSNTAYDLRFEQAVDHLIFGELEQLKALLIQQPALLAARSTYGHQATLLHYTASNGVEMWRQQVPYNLAVVVTFLLDKGADPQAKMKVYGGEFTTAELLKTSAHPYEAGVAKEVLKLLGH